LDLFTWIPIIRDYATLHEMQTVYYMEDALMMHVAIKLRDKIEEDCHGNH